MEAFAQAFLERLAGSQGRALSRGSQAAKSPFETRCPTRVSTKLLFLARPQTRKAFRSLRRAIKTKVKLISPCGGRGNQRGIPPSADGGQHTHFIRARRGNKDSGLRATRLDRAGPQARTRLSPTGGNGCGARAGINTVLWFFTPPSHFRDRYHPRGSNNPRRLHAAGYNHRLSCRYAPDIRLRVPAGHRPGYGYYCRNGSR